MNQVIILSDILLSLSGAKPGALAALPKMDQGTVFLVLLALCAVVTVWGVMQLIGILGSGDDRIEQRLGLRDVKQAVSTDSALLMKLSDSPAWVEQSEKFRKFAMRLDLVSSGQTVTQFFMLTAVCALAFGGLLTWLLGFLPYGLTAGILGGLLPFMRFKMAYGKRRKIMADQLIEALDFLSRVLRAGHSLPSGLQMVGEELPEPIATEFRRCYEQHNLGLSLDQALNETAKRVDLEDFAFFVTSVSIQRQTGGDLAEILDNINAMVRSRIRLGQHVQALTAEGRFTGYVLTALPVVVFVLMYLANPEYAGELTSQTMGRIMLFVAVMLQFLGLLVIRKIVNIRV
jgi:tight adherence protein B